MVMTLQGERFRFAQALYAQNKALFAWKKNPICLGRSKKLQNANLAQFGCLSFWIVDLLNHQP